MKHEQARRRQAKEELRPAGGLGHGVRWTVCLLLTLASAIGFSKLLDPHSLPIKEVKVEGEFRHLRPEYLEGIVVNTLNAGFFLLDVDAVRRALLSEPWINDVSVRRIWPDTVQVTVVEQRAEAVWCDKALVNDAAVIFAPDPDSFPVGLARLCGPEGSHEEVLERYKAMHAVLKDYDLDFEELSLSDRRAWSLHLKNGPTVIIGRKDVETRIGHLCSVLDNGLDSNLKGIETIDLRYTNGVAVRFREADA